MIYSGLTISHNPHIIIGKLYFTDIGEPYIESIDKIKYHIERSLVFWETINPIEISNKISTF